jgi:hypothetical protein
MKQKLKNVIQEDAKSFTAQQLYIDGMCFLRNDLIEIINRQMSRDYKIEFGYEFIKLVKDFIKQFCKIYKSKNNKLKYIEKINDDIEEIDIMIEIISTLKLTDTYNWVGLTEGQIINIRKNWGKILNHYEKYENWILKNYSEKAN